MRDLELITLACMEKLDKLGIPYGNILEVTINTRAKSRWGQCRHCAEGHKINISARLLDDSTDIRGLENTILHELLHTAPGCNNHGAVWKAYAEKVNAAYGYNIKRASTAYEKGVAGAEKPVDTAAFRRTIKTRNQTRYTVESIRDFVEDIAMRGWEIIVLEGAWIDSYICLSPDENHWNYVFRANDDCYNGYYTQRRCRKISAALQAEIDAEMERQYKI